MLRTDLDVSNPFFLGPPLTWRLEADENPLINNKVGDEKAEINNLREARHNNIIPLSDPPILSWQDTMYAVAVTAGSPPQNFTVIPDVGGSSFFLFDPFIFSIHTKDLAFSWSNHLVLSFISDYSFLTF